MFQQMKRRFAGYLVIIHLIPNKSFIGDMKTSAWVHLLVMSVRLSISSAVFHEDMTTWFENYYTTFNIYPAVQKCYDDMALLVMSGIRNLFSNVIHNYPEPITTV
ncbi:unnamed protein product [Schistosoma rodhaini]|uniref:Uncharacterized protein n=1 Tax=Schistosoma rodhaini TaxID=6188 RepID=A0AA85G3C2_9TREM|nr:unnamed protein product [Schistosoma rodhaini]